MTASSSISRRALLQAGVLATSGVTASVAARGPGEAEPIRLALIESLSGSFANTGEAVTRNLMMAIEQVNDRDGVRTTQGRRPLLLLRYDNKGQVEESLAMLRAAVDGGCRFVLQGNSSAVAAALIDAIDKHNQREPERRVVFLNYSAVDPVLTNERCSFWHFRFDAHADMRMSALMEVLREDAALRDIYLIGQDYSFGQAVLREARRQLGRQRPNVRIVAEELHPVGRIKDFMPYAVKIHASGAQAVLTGNWGSDLTLLVKAARDVGFEGRFYTFYGNALGAPAAIGEAGVGKVVAVADWLPNVATRESAAFYEAFRRRFPRPQDDYVHLRMFMLIEALAQAIERAHGVDPLTVARQLERADVTLAGRRGRMRATDHQFQQPLVVGVMERKGTPGVRFDVEGSGYGFRVVREIGAERAAQGTTCRMVRP